MFVLQILFPIIPCLAFAGLPTAMFWKKHTPKLVFTTSSQSVLASNCSGAVTINNQNWLGTVTNVTSDLTVNLSATGSATFYSDSSCTQTITSATMVNGTNSLTAYFISTSTGSTILTATANTYAPTSQSETISTNPYVWTGNGVNANWNTAANWSGGAVPGASNVAVFDGSCVSNCSPTISANINIAGLRMASGYSGTITHGAGNTITVGTKGWTQISGTFLGSSSADAITISGNMSLVGGTYTATSGTITFSGSRWSILNNPTFNANSGLISFGGNTSNIIPGSITYYSVTFSSWGTTYNLGGGTMNVNGTLLFNTGGGTTNYINSGTIVAHGNVTSMGPTAGFDGSVVIQVAGNASGQTITSTANYNSIPNLVIAAGGDPVTFGTDVTVSGNYTLTSVGTFTSSGSTLTLKNGGSINPGTVTYNNLTFTGAGSTFNLGGGTMNVNGALLLNNTSGLGYVNNINSGTIKAYGNVTATGVGTGFGGTAIVQMAGNASGQSLSSNSSTSTFPNLVIAAGSNPITLGTTVAINGNYTMTSVGSLTATGSTLVFRGGGVITPGAVAYNDVTFIGCSSFSFNNGTFKIEGNLLLQPNCGSVSQGLSSGTFNLSGNLTEVGATGVIGDLALNFVGSNNQTVTRAAGAPLPWGNVTVNTSGGANLVLGSAVSWNYGAQSLTVISGGVTMGGNALTVGSLNLNSNTITKGGGALTVNGVVAGTGSLYGGTVNP